MDDFLISDFKTRCISLIKNVRRTGKAIRVTSRGEPLAIISPAHSSRSNEVKLGMLQGSVLVHGEIVETDLSDEWESLK